MSKKHLKYIRIAFLALGAFFFFLLLKKIGLKDVLNNLHSIGWKFILVLLVSGSWYPLYTLAWEQFLRALDRKVSFFSLYRVKLSGEAVNTLTPLSFVGGDPARVYLLRNHIPLSEGAASVVVDRTLHTLGILVVVISGMIVAFLTIDKLPLNIKYGMPIIIVVALTFMGFILVHQRRGIFTLIIQILRRLRIKKEFSEKTLERIEKLDSHITTFYRKNPARFWIALLCHTAGRLLGVVEIYIVGHLASPDFGWLAALFLCALAPIVNMIFSFIPGALGVLEGAYSAVLYFLGLDPAIGITIQLAKRARAAFWIGIGLLSLGASERKVAMHAELEAQSTEY